MSYPLMISLIIEHMIGLTDAVFLGRVGDVALGACALGGVYYMAMFMLAFGFGFGAQIIIARRNGERRYNRIAPTMVQGCYFMLVLAVALFAASQYFSPIILRDIIESPQVYGATADYLHWRTYGIFFSFLCVMFRAYYVGITQTKISDGQFHCHAPEQCRVKLLPHFRERRLSRRRHSRGGHCLQRIGSSLPSLFHHLHKHDGG